MKIALYPGTFDPVTHGHTDIIKRALALFDKVIVAIANNPSKQTTFSTQERFELLQAVVGNEKRVDIISFSEVENIRALNAGVLSLVKQNNSFNNADVIASQILCSL